MKNLEDSNNNIIIADNITPQIDETTPVINNEKEETSKISVPKILTYLGGLTLTAGVAIGSFFLSDENNKEKSKLQTIIFGGGGAISFVTLTLKFCRMVIRNRATQRSEKLKDEQNNKTESIIPNFPSISPEKKLGAVIEI